MPNESRLTSEGNSRVEIKRSVFIGHCAYVASPAEAADFIAKERKLYPDARHICYAWRTGGDSANQKSSDDGEPSGTAGQPLLALLTDNGLNNTIICVTRYFGGILLGTGGLARAYSSAAKAALDEAGLSVMADYAVCGILCSYSDYTKLSSKLSSVGAKEEESVFGTEVELVVSCLSTSVDALSDLVTQITAGRSALNVIRHEERPKT